MAPRAPALLPLSRMDVATPHGVQFPASMTGVDVGLPTAGRVADSRPSGPVPARPDAATLCDEYERVEALYQATGDRPGTVGVLDWQIECPTPASVLAFLDYIAYRRMNDFATTVAQPLIVDCGANIGYTALWYKRLFPRARIIAFEPDPVFAPMLRRNLAANGATDVTVVPAAAWIANGTAPWIAHASDGSRLASDRGEASTSVETIDLAAALADLGDVELLKIDVEGAEFDLVPHLAGALSRVRRVLVECHILRQEHYGRLAVILETLRNDGFTVAMNSYGPWRDLVHQHRPAPLHAEQYLLVSAWRGDPGAVDPEATIAPYHGLAAMLAGRRAQRQHDAALQQITGLLLDLAGGAAASHRLELRPPFRRELGACWLTICPQLPAGDDDRQQQALTFVLEDGRPLGPAHAVHEAIRQQGQGRYSHWRQALYWSTSDNSDPNTNGRSYEVVHLVPARCG